MLAETDAYTRADRSSRLAAHSHKTTEPAAEARTTLRLRPRAVARQTTSCAGAVARMRTMNRRPGSTTRGAAMTARRARTPAATASAGGGSLGATSPGVAAGVGDEGGDSGGRGGGEGAGASDGGAEVGGVGG